MSEGKRRRKILFIALSIFLMLAAIAGFCFGVTPILFCDTGPTAVCLQSGLVILIGAGFAFVLSIVLAAIAFKRKRA